MTDQDLIRGYQRTIEDLRLELARSHEALERIAALEPKLAEMLRSLGIVVDAENDGGWSTTAYMIRGFVSEADNIARAALQASSPTIPNQEMAWHVHTQPSDTEERQTITFDREEFQAWFKSLPDLGDVLIPLELTQPSDTEAER